MNLCRQFPQLLLALALVAPPLAAQTPAPATANPYASASDFEAYAKKLREDMIRQAGSTVVVATGGRDAGRYPWKKNICTTVFWVGETPTENNPATNERSAWDPYWKHSYGGYDDPNNRVGYLPAGFVPSENPFYVALPYSDVRECQTAPEAPNIIPWFKKEFKENGKSVCKGRWLAIRYGKRVCYAQWEDVGPFKVDHWQYVFGNERPAQNLNNSAGLDVSPAVRDYLGINGMSVTDWRFVETHEVPPGPWRQLGENNIFARRATATEQEVAVNDTKPKTEKTSPKPEEKKAPQPGK